MMNCIPPDRSTAGISFDRSTGCGKNSSNTTSTADKQIIVFKERAGKPGGGKGILIAENRAFTLAIANCDHICYEASGFFDGAGATRDISYTSGGGADIES